MASNLTAHYGLNQWAAADSFVRTEFNRDNEKIDAAVFAAQKTAERALDELVPVSHNIYNLILQNYYEGHQTGFKKALIFDGFMDGAMISSMSTGLVRMQNKLMLIRNGQGDLSTGAYYQAQSIPSQVTTPVCTATSYGRLTGAVVKTKNLVNEAQTISRWDTVIKMNGVVISSGSYSLWCNANCVAAEQNLYFGDCDVKPGDQFVITTRGENNNHQLFLNASGQVAGRFLVTPYQASAGTVTTPSLTLPNRSRLRAWVRHKGGAVTLTAKSGGTSYPMIAGATRQTTSLQGEPCAEQEFLLDTPPQSGALIFVLGLDLRTDDVMKVYDYGVLLT